MRMSYRCLEAECDFECEVQTDEELVEVVQQHMDDAHNTFELEDVILANATRTDTTLDEASPPEP
jgi:predicted small metal-binding protein